MAGGAVDADRLRRALGLHVERVGADTLRVRGGARVHHIRGGACDCEDAAMRRGVWCKHVLAAQLHRLPGPTLDGLRDLVNEEED
jgi:hypothetical protein